MWFLSLSPSPDLKDVAVKATVQERMCSPVYVMWGAAEVCHKPSEVGSDLLSHPVKGPVASLRVL